MFSEAISLLVRGSSRETRPRQAFELLCEAADRGHVRSMALAGYLLLRPCGWQTNRARSNEFLHRARAVPGADALAVALAAYCEWMEKEGKAELEVVEKHRTAIVAAAHTLEKEMAEVKGGVVVLISTFGASLCYRMLGQHESAARLLRPGAEQGFMLAQCFLGVMYACGEGVEQNKAEAVRFYRLAGDQGYAMAYYNLATLHFNGDGVAQDTREAVRLFRLAAEQGNALAQYFLGMIYAEGNGVAQDKREASRLYHLAADHADHAGAACNLGVMYEKGEGVGQSKTTAAQYYRLAAKQGYAMAQGNLAVLFYTGQGVSEDRTEAMRLFRLAAAQGDVNAQTALRLLPA